MSLRQNNSNNSLRTSSLNSKSALHSEEITNVENIIQILKQNNETLKKSLDFKDVRIGNLVREKEKLYEELKCAQRTNRNLYQQLTDERDIHFKEKEYLVDDIKRLSFARRGDILFTSLQEEIKEKDEIIYNLCAKYLKMKSNKIILQKRLMKLQKHSEKLCENLILILQENREALDILLNNLLRMSNISKAGKKLLKLLKTNARLYYENTQLKIYMITGKETYIKEGISMPSFRSLKYSSSKEKDIFRCKPKQKCLQRSMSTNANHFFKYSEGITDLKTIHNSLSPHLSRELYRSKSDSNLTNLK
ncbi:unnamed protein product [Parnassius mnemosyne]|uniref:Uncharacterized protein n=1 Tax=Parnassius mnemosyne TaxID=213953 RepID=A0AAV1LFY0_9NEOP